MSEEMLAELMRKVDALQKAMTKGGTGLPDSPMTVADLVVLAESLTESSSLRTYRSAWRALVEGIAAEPGVSEVPALGGKFAHEVTTVDLKKFLEPLTCRARRRNESRDVARYEAGRAQRRGSGQVAMYNAVGAWRRLFAIAEDARAIPRGTNPAAALKKPGRATASRTWLSDGQMAEVLSLASASGDDPELDGLLCQFHLITGARQEGALNLFVRHVDLKAGMVTLDEKNGKIAEQPVPDWLAVRLLEFAASRGSTAANDPVFVKKSRSGRVTRVTPRRYNYIFERLQSLSEWMDREQVTAHTLRHCAGKLVERHAGKMVAEAFLRHARSGVTDGYTWAKPDEVARAVIDLWGGRHPMVTSSHRRLRAQ